MIATITRRELRDLRWSIVGFASGIAVYILVITAFFPNVRDNAASYEALLDAYPDALKEIFGLQDMSTLAGFVGSEVLSLVWPIIMAVFVITAATGLVAGEVERGTANLWLSVPVPRRYLLLGKLIGLVIGVIVVVAATAASLYLGSLLVDALLPLSSILALTASLLAFALAICGVTTLLSAGMSERGKAGGLAALLILMAYLAWIASSLSTNWHWLRFFSVFSAFNPQAALSEGSVNMGHLLILLTIALFAWVAATIVFERRDVIG